MPGTTGIKGPMRETYIFPSKVPQLIRSFEGIETHLWLICVVRIFVLIRNHGWTPGFLFHSSGRNECKRGRFWTSNRLAADEIIPFLSQRLLNKTVVGPINGGWGCCNYIYKRMHLSDPIRRWGIWLLACGVTDTRASEVTDFSTKASSFSP